MTDRPWFALVESNTTGSGRQFCAATRAQGLRPVVLTSDPRRYPYLQQDQIEVIRLDTADRAAVVAACERLSASGLAGVTSSSEYYIATAAAAAAAVGLPGPVAEAVDACRDKGTQRELLSTAGISTPRYRVAGTAAQAVAAVADTGLPAVVKPTTGSGSIGVRLCRTVAAIADHAAGLLAMRVNTSRTACRPSIVVEEYVRGPEFSVEAIAGQPIGITSKHLSAAPYFVEIGHDFPAPVSEVDSAALMAATVDALGALDLGFGASHTELRLTQAGPVVIEVNPRLAGGMIPALVQEATGIDLVSCCIALAAGTDASYSPTRSASSAIRFLLAPRAGRVTHLAGLAEAAALDGIRTVNLSVRTGDVIPPLDNSFRDRLGYVLAGGADLEGARAAAERALAGISITVEPE